MAAQEEPKAIKDVVEAAFIWAAKQASDHPVIKTMIQAIISITLAVVVNLATDNNEASRKWIWLLAIVVFMIFQIFFEMLNQNNPDKKNLEKVKGERDSYRLLLTHFRQFCDQKHDNQARRIKAIRDSEVSPPEVYTEPDALLQKHLDSLLDVLGVFLCAEDIASDSCAHLLYQFGANTNWRHVPSTRAIARDISYLMEENTPAYYLLNVTREDFLLKSKKELEDLGYYPRSGRNGDCLCSVIHFKGIIGDEIKAVLLVSTARNVLFKEETENLKQIIEQFELRFRIELTNLYTQYLYKTKQ